MKLIVATVNPGLWYSCGFSVTHKLTQTLLSSGCVGAMWGVFNLQGCLGERFVSSDIHMNVNEWMSFQQNIELKLF